MLKNAMIDSSNLLIGMDNWFVKIAQIGLELKEIIGIVLLTHVMVIKSYILMDLAQIVQIIPCLM